jgi:hypothetical protein
MPLQGSLNSGVMRTTDRSSPRHEKECGDEEQQGL